MVILELEQQPPLIQAIFTGDLKEVKTLLSQQQDVNVLDVVKRSPLHAAAFKGDAPIVALLLSQGARVNAKDNKWYTPLHRACCTGSEETVCLLLRYQADVNARDRHWQTPLHVAAANGMYHCVAQLLERVPNPNITDRSRRTALHHAAYNGHTDVAELLISKGCIVNACDKTDCTPLHFASYIGHITTMELLLHHGADINAKGRNQYAPLHAVAASGMETACQVLLSAGADVDIQNSYGNTPLHIACLNGNVSICMELVAYGANLEAINYRGQTALHIAAASTHGVDCLTFLLDQNVDINKQSMDGRTALHMTALHGKFTRSNMLINKGAAIDCVDKNNCTALHIASQSGTELLTSTLLSFGADPNRKGYEGRTPLHMCCLSGYVECCRKFIQAGVDINALDDSGKTPMHCAAYRGSAACLDLLISNGADFQSRDNVGRLPLHYAALEGNYQCVFTLVSIGSPVNCTDVEGCSPLHLAAGYNVSDKCVNYLIQHKADATLRDNNGYTATHYAVAGKNTQALSSLLLLENISASLHAPEAPKTTPLHLSILAARHGNLDILLMLLPLFPDVNLRTERGSTPLLLAAREGNASCVQGLLRHGAKVAMADEVFGMTAVHASAQNGSHRCLALLLDNTEDNSVVDKLDRLQRTPLMLAVSEDHSACVVTLLNHGADINITDADGHSALFRAVVAGHNGIVQLLISKGANVGTLDVHGKTVLHLAAVCGHLGCLQTVCSYMKEEQASVLDNQSCTALHWTCYIGNEKCTQHILQQEMFKTLEGNPFTPVHCASYSGSERCLELLCKYYGSKIVHLEDSRKRRPLHIAACHGHLDCVRYLLEEGAVTEVYDDQGRTPLIVAAQNGHSSVIELLIKLQADITACDTQENTALHWACFKKHSHAALLLLDYIDDPKIVNMANARKKTPLHLAARNGLVEVTEKLLKTGASMLLPDSEGLTPVLCCAINDQVAQCLTVMLTFGRQLPLPHSATKDFSETFLKLKKTKLKTFASEKSQTEISLLHNPDLSECERLFNIRPVLKVTPRAPEARRDFLSVFRVDAGRDGDPEPAGLSLHHSHSDMHIAEAEKCRSHLAEPRVRVSRPTQRKDIVDYTSVNKSCLDCVFLRKRCAGCTLRKLMRQHIIGKLKVDELKATLIKICSEATSDYKRSMIKALEEFRQSVQEKKTRSRRSMATHRIENIIDAVATTRNLLMEVDMKGSFLNTRDGKSLMKTPSEREGARVPNIRLHSEAGKSGIPRLNVQKVQEQLSEDNIKRLRTQRLAKVQDRKVKKMPQVPKKDAFIKRELQEIYSSKEKSIRETSASQVLPLEEPPFKIIETASDDGVWKMCEIQQHHEENAKKLMVETFQSLQKTKLMPGVFDLVAKDGLERLEARREQRGITEYIRSILEEEVVENVVEGKKEVQDVVCACQEQEEMEEEKPVEEQEFIEETSAETLFVKLREAKLETAVSPSAADDENVVEDDENDVQDGENVEDGENDARSVEINEETENLVFESRSIEDVSRDDDMEQIEADDYEEIIGKTIGSCCISLVEYDTVKEDQIWSKIEANALENEKPVMQENKVDDGGATVLTENVPEEFESTVEKVTMGDMNNAEENLLEQLLDENQEDGVNVPEKCGECTDASEKTNNLLKKKLVKSKDAASPRGGDQFFSPLNGSTDNLPCDTTLDNLANMFISDNASHSSDEYY